MFNQYHISTRFGFPTHFYYQFILTVKTLGLQIAINVYNGDIKIYVKWGLNLPGPIYNFQKI